MAAEADSSDRAELDARPPHRRGVRRRWLSSLTGLRRDRRGVSAVEFALATPVLLALIVPVIDLGPAFSEPMKVQQAAQAGGQ